MRGCVTELKYQDIELDLEKEYIPIIPILFRVFLLKNKNKNTTKYYAEKKITIYRRMRPID